MDLRQYDSILVNSSAGKDSQAMLDYVCKLASAQGVLDRVVVVHADLGRVEWKGTKELAEEQAQAYGVKFELTKYQGMYGDNLLDYIRARKKWPDSKNRFCTSEFKRGPVGNVMTEIAKGFRAQFLSLARAVQKALGYKVPRILNCLGFRKDESPARAKREPFAVNKRFSTSRKHIDDWLPIHDWTVDEVWSTIKASGVRYHYAYDLGMPRLSCCFCVFAPKDALVIAGLNNPELLDEYVELEKEIGHDFRHKEPIAEIKALIASGYQPKQVQNWTM